MVTEAKMTELLTFIIAHFSFLYEDYEAHFANSVNDRGDAMILFNLNVSGNEVSPRFQIR